MVNIDHLCKQYGDYRLDISMQIPSGRIVGLVGKNGAGKSTTIKAILGLVQPDQGTVTVFEKPADQLGKAEKENMGVALSDSGFSQYLNLEDITRILKKSYPAFDEVWFRRQCREQSLPMNKELKDFSTGMKARVRVLTAMSHKGSLLIMDEPTAGLDVEAREEILAMLRDYMAEDETRSILITSHISSDLEHLCDEIYLIHDGQVILHEDTDAIIDSYGVLKVSPEQFAGLDQQYLLTSRKTGFGYECFTNQKQYYRENYPEIVVERSGIDELILMMTTKR
ncbi:MAG: ABC transporter ATP-binding protein [Lachnospiraceae bacterium]|nr:ABC transporter ATP-binding protein [Lachnospiraceae bacterium]